MIVPTVSWSIVGEWWVAGILEVHFRGIVRSEHDGGSRQEVVRARVS